MKLFWTNVSTNRTEYSERVKVSVNIYRKFKFFPAFKSLLPYPYLRIPMLPDLILIKMAIAPLPCQPKRAIA
ncbi:MAG: hypothetical protein QNJ74_25730 [Trichodesmium sp. MO_231.B1]|nr:hypothetical protein [Trichodesmium sp. MO_231.B1]